MKKNFAIIICVVALVLTIVFSSIAIGAKNKSEEPINSESYEVEMTEEISEEETTEALSEKLTEEVVEETTKVQKVELTTKKSEEAKLAETTTESTETEKEETEDEFFCDGIINNMGQIIIIGMESSLFDNEDREEKLASYYSTDESVAVVDEYGTITTVSVGTTMIYAEKENGLERFECEVTVYAGFEMECVFESEINGTCYMYLDIDGVIPEGSYIEWTADNDNFELIEFDDGMGLKAVPKKFGSTMFTVTVYYSNGTILAQESMGFATFEPTICH
jgi:TolB-like protein